MQLYNVQGCFILYIEIDIFIYKYVYYSHIIKQNISQIKHISQIKYISLLNDKSSKTLIKEKTY